ncbi:MAG: acyl-CoA dehydrogenase family protein [Bacillota bacterium]
MYDLAFTEEQERIRQVMKEFAEKEIAPGAAERDEGEDYAPAYEIMKKIGKLGFWGLPYPVEYGGAGMDQISYALASIELNKVDASLGCSYSVQVSLAGYPIFAFGTEEQRQKYSVPMFKGQSLGAFGLTEPNAGSDSGAAQTTAVLDGDYYVLNGTKCFITNSGYNDWTVVFAMTDKSKGVKGLSAFIVETNTPGFTHTKIEKKMGIRSTVQRVIEMENCRVPKENLLGKEGEGFKIAMKTLDGGRIGIAAQGVGIAEGAYEYALNYARERVQFGKPIIHQQIISFKLAEMHTKIEAAKALTLKAAWCKDNNLPYSKEAAMAKMFATDTAMQVTTDAVQIMGGAGFLRDHPVERMMRDAKITQIYEGTNEIQKLVISGFLMK